MKKDLDQWELPNNSKVKLGDGEFVIFKKMDGMYAQWEQDGKLKIGNFHNKFRKVEDSMGSYYELIKEE